LRSTKWGSDETIEKQGCGDVEPALAQHVSYGNDSYFESTETKLLEQNAHNTMPLAFLLKSPRLQSSRLCKEL
jgi:hypothetical protein